MDADIEERIKIRQENEEKLKAWEANRKAEAERREREEKQQRLANYLQGRAETWMEHTGTRPPMGMIEKWQQDYVEKAAADAELDLELRRAQAAAQETW